MEVDDPKSVELKKKQAGGSGSNGAKNKNNSKDGKAPAVRGCCGAAFVRCCTVVSQEGMRDAIDVPINTR